MTAVTIGVVPVADVAPLYLGIKHWQDLQAEREREDHEAQQQEDHRRAGGQVPDDAGQQGAA